MSRGVQNDEDQQNSPNHPLRDIPLTGPTLLSKGAVGEKSLLQPLVMQFSVILQVGNNLYYNRSYLVHAVGQMHHIRMHITGIL